MPPRIGVSGQSMWMLNNLVRAQKRDRETDGLAGPPRARGGCMSFPRLAFKFRMNAAMVAAGLTLLSRGEVAQAQVQAPASPQTGAGVAHRDEKDPRWVWGTVTVNASQDEVWSRFQKVQSWPSILSDIARLQVTGHRDQHWDVKLETKTLGHGMLGYDVDAGPDRVIRLKTDQFGVHALAVTRVLPGPTATQTNVSYALFLELKGAPSLLIGSASLREKQDHMVSVSLADIRRTFGGA